MKWEVRRPIKGVDYSTKKIIEVHETTNYHLFAFDEQNNREVDTDSDHFAKLKDSIKREGLKDPIWVVEEERGGTVLFVIAAGQHRFEACKALGVPVEFIIIDDDSYSLLLRVVLDSLTKKNILKDFIDMGAARGYKIFKIVKQLVSDFCVEFNNKYSAAFETVFTIIANRRKKVYRNSQFMKHCKISPEITNNTLDQYANWPIYEEEIDAIYKHTRIVADIARAIRKNRIGVNFNREMLRLLTPAKEVESTPEEILAFLTKKENSEFREELGKVYSGKDSQIRSTLKRIDEQILSSSEISKRRIKRIKIEPDVKKSESVWGKEEEIV